MINKKLVDMYDDLYGSPEPELSSGPALPGENPPAPEGVQPVKDAPAAGDGQNAGGSETIGESQAEEQTQATEEKDPMEELDALIGLHAIKHDVKELIAYAKIQKLRADSGLQSVPVSLHLVFTGNPGTGKTTVARIIAKLYKQIGVLSKGQLVEVDRSGLVAGYVGQTALKTQEKIEEAMGGILFIDEAYALAKEGNDYGQEAVDTVLKAMEDKRSDFVVIVAGYTEPMKVFIESNPGLKSRFNKYIEFADYTMKELTEIFLSFCKKYDYEIDDENLERVTNLLRLKKTQTLENFANAREVRNLFEEIITNQARRLSETENPSVEDLRTIVYEDLFDEEQAEEEPEAAEESPADDLTGDVDPSEEEELEAGGES
ncbi:MAG: AAA family ATPase [Parasporobacterium sp.]|nr:AAA family ATPase [Parasporobacterium sp.]